MPDARGGIRRAIWADACTSHQTCADGERLLDEMMTRQDSRLRLLCDALGKITEGVGPYSRDPLTHCANTVEAMQAIAREALAAIREDVVGDA